MRSVSACADGVMKQSVPGSLPVYPTASSRSIRTPAPVRVSITDVRYSQASGFRTSRSTCSAVNVVHTRRRRPPSVIGVNGSPGRGR